MHTFWLLASTVMGVAWSPDDLSTLQNSTSLIVTGLLDYYPVASSEDSVRLGATPGVFQQPYYWWEAGVAWGVMVDWQYYTEQYGKNDMIKEAMEYQMGTNGNYMPANQSMTEGNDDQGFWALAVMTAAERNFTNPSGNHGWLYSAQAVFNEMVQRWETTTCGGGLRWQIYTWNSGYNYKNVVSNGCFFNLAARLARYTGNSSYADWADKIFDWMTTNTLLFEDGDDWKLYDGATMESNCSTKTEIEWSYNYGLVISGSAYLYDFYNSSSTWLTRVTDVWNRASTQFFQNSIAYESACQPSGKCNNDQRCFKGIFLQLLGQAARLVPALESDIMTAINATAAAAAGSCSGGYDGHTCGLNWLDSSYDNMYGLGEQISALSAMSVTQVLSKNKPYTANNGGSSNGSVDAGVNTGSSSLLSDDTPISGKDKAGAGVITAVLMLFLIGVGVWILI